MMSLAHDQNNVLLPNGFRIQWPDAAIISAAVIAINHQHCTVQGVKVSGQTCRPLLPTAPLGKKDREEEEEDGGEGGLLAFEIGRHKQGSEKVERQTALWLLLWLSSNDLYFSFWTLDPPQK